MLDGLKFMSNIFIGLITDNKELNNLKELIKVSGNFSGLAVTYHGKSDEEGFQLLNDNKGYGFIECLPYVGHHEHSKNHWLFNPKIKLFDWVLIIDSAERINSDFAFNIKPFIKMLENQNINSVYNYSKLLLFKRFPNQFFTSTPHWGFQGARNHAISIEKEPWFRIEKEYVYSIRDQRPKLSWVNHYLRYYLCLDSNHNLLGAEHFGDPADVFQKREHTRMQFLLYLQRIGVENNENALINYWKNNPLSDDMEKFVSSVRILNDAYLYNVLGDEDLTDDIKRLCKPIKFR